MQVFCLLAPIIQRDDIAVLPGSRGIYLLFKRNFLRWVTRRESESGKLILWTKRMRVLSSAQFDKRAVLR